MIGVSGGGCLVDVKSSETKMQASRGAPVRVPGVGAVVSHSRQADFRNKNLQQHEHKHCLSMSKKNQSDNS